MLQMREDTTEYVKATVSADHDITGDIIEVSFPAQVNPGTEVWNAAEVVSVLPSSDGKSWVASYRIMVGPNGGTVALTAGAYNMLVKVHDNPETPVRLVDTVKITS